MPEPLAESNPGVVSMDGFTFTFNGLFHDLSQEDWAVRSVPSFAPLSPAMPKTSYDTGLDGPKGSEDA
jgi:hypothetical protein